MGCGSPLGDLFYLADRLLASPPSYSSPPCSPVMGKGQEKGVRDRLYRMFGEGQISEGAFTALRSLAEKGQLRSVDLAVHSARARKSSVQPDDPATTNALRGIHSRLTQLAQARNASGKVLAALEARISDLDGRIAKKEEAARQTVQQDEKTARKRLAEKVELAGNREKLVAQAQALRADLSSLDDLRAKLETKSIELEAVQARSRLREEVLK
ncbi:MAG: hypothetical protein AB1345_05990 [Chloroflexota bacterium]